MFKQNKLGQTYPGSYSHQTTRQNLALKNVSRLHRCTGSVYAAVTPRLYRTRIPARNLSACAQLADFKAVRISAMQKHRNYHSQWWRNERVSGRGRHQSRRRNGEAHQIKVSLGLRWREKRRKEVAGWRYQNGRRIHSTRVGCDGLLGGN
jgi:hypothetical protein